MNVCLDVILVFLVLSSLWLLGSSRLQACIQAVAFQGLLLGLIPMLSKLAGHNDTFGGVAVVSTIIKAIVLPIFLRRAIREADVRNEVDPLVGFTTSLLLGIGLWGMAMHLAGRLPPMPSISPLLVPVAIFTVMCGLLLIVSRNTALMQVIGYLALENGDIRVRLGICGGRSDASRDGRIAGCFRGSVCNGHNDNHLSREFDSIETDELASLKD